MSEINPELKNIVEAALLVAGQPLTVDKMQAMFPEGSQPAREDIRAVLEALASEYAARGVELREIGKGWRIQTREKYAEYVARLLEERPPRYTRALLETLAIIAYRQPVTRGEIEHIRGVSVSTDIIRTLTERGWIKEVGRRDVPGRPALLGTTREFLEHFNLKSLEDLPPLAELRSLDEIGAELANREATGGETMAPETSGTGAEPAVPGHAAFADPETDDAREGDDRAASGTTADAMTVLAHPHDPRG